jgi:hypothetical protein
MEPGCSFLVWNNEEWEVDKGLATWLAKERSYTHSFSTRAFPFRSIVSV